MFSCCCLSRQTSILRRLGSLVVSVNISCRSVENCFSVSLTAFPRSKCSVLLRPILVLGPFWYTVLTHDITMIAQLVIVHLQKWINLCLRTGLREFESATVLFFVSLFIHSLIFKINPSLCCNNNNIAHFSFIIFTD